jgi:pimeloyl-ACP methyl ester carboxylesterase
MTKQRTLAPWPAISATVWLVACTTAGGPGSTASSAPTASTSNACQTFASQTRPGITLQAESIAADTARPPGTTTGPMLAAHCRLTGKMGARVGQDGKPYHIGFELRLPTQWNGRLLYQGGGGNDGVVRPAVGPQAAPGYALNRGFAVVTTDAGHQGPTADFGFDMQARIDNAYAAHDRVATTAKDLLKGYFGKAADRSYFIGCSGGGRQGMMFTQRFPHHFDGVIAMAPAMRVSSGATVAAAWDTQALQAIAPPGADGQPVLSRALSNGDLGVLRQGILNACDAQDGLTDGIVSHPAACTFDVRKLQCSGAKQDSCLSAAQVSTLNKMTAGARTSDNKPLYFAWPWDAGMGHPANDWRAWRLGTSTTATPNSRHVFLMQDALQGYFVTPPDRSLTMQNFNFDRDPARMAAHSWIFDTANDTKLDGYKARGGKLILAHGMADPIFSPTESIDYYQRLQQTQGPAANDLARLFLIPGMGHCQGGAATDQWDGLGALVDWVEKGQAPQRITAKGSAVFPNRTRPLCAFPTHAQYNGSGDPEDAANFSCK